MLKRYLERGIREVGTDDSEEVSSVVHQTCHHVWIFEERVIDCSGDMRLRRRIWIRRGEDDITAQDLSRRQWFWRSKK